MSDEIPPRPMSYEDARSDPLGSLLADLQNLSAYLHQRSDRSYKLAEQFVNHARVSPETRAYDERQSTMLEYQHQIWREIAGQVDRLVRRYTEVSQESDENTQSGLDSPSSEGG
jgi:hemerythrin-like domain-containing protein